MGGISRDILPPKQVILFCLRRRPPRIERAFLYYSYIIFRETLVREEKQGQSDDDVDTPFLEEKKEVALLWLCFFSTYLR